MTERRSEFTLASGRAIQLFSLKQWDEYAWVLEGLPTRERNDAALARLVAEAQQEDGHDPFLIVPVQKPIAYEGRYPFGEPAALPEIGCIGRFRSLGPARDLGADYSALTVIWFQEHYAFPIDAEVERAIVAVDWDRLAIDREY
ncbi:MAG TPA: hypothetical protein VIF57_24430 [Polyangia bacterium]|jgi:hypothetical protein